MRVLFVCTGNTCRSPLAEGIARQVIEQRDIPSLTVSSAGTSAWPGSPASDGSLQVALEHEIDLSRHRAQPLTPQLVASSDVILTMGSHHLQQAEALGGAGRSWLLTAFSDPDNARSISDPFGGDLDVYRATYRELVPIIRAAVDRIVRDRAGGTEPLNG